MPCGGGGPTNLQADIKSQLRGSGAQELAKATWPRPEQAGNSDEKRKGGFFMLREHGCANCRGKWSQVNKPLTHSKLKSHCLILLNKHFPLTFMPPSAMIITLANEWKFWAHAYGIMKVSLFYKRSGHGFFIMIKHLNMASTMQTLFDESKYSTTEQKEALTAN